ncbi:hormonally up-regulated neu tumor-associated kinase homolog [Corythoichthys intestinalis]|uniref:hormonally up-regulated neu tumor-associated kinase homolog n=1 Tax=Corythoichthys intestinalis TaxID=161448 RepID=UPI0025A4CE21|nr:hormonally up-regulated neu tumor-associated kinase homolog [Corythoichthys intestinalis]
MPGAAVKVKGGVGGRGSAGPDLLAPPSKDLLRSFPHTKRVGSYLVGKMINKGSFAKVMEGLHLDTGEKVAIKVIDKKKARQDSYVHKNMKREAYIHQMIRHPNVVVLLETLETENSYYMVLELCAGGDLMDRICDRKRLPEKEVRRYTRQILSAVAHLHQHGIVHRDLKIENFLLDEHNNIKIVDFGLSNTLRSESLPAELLSTQCGSPAYAAPELLAHQKYGPKVDVWSIGVSVFAMLTGTLPFTVEPFNIKQLHHKMVDGDIAHIPSDVSKGAVTFVLSLLEADPDVRPSVRTAMEAPWINQGYAKRPLHTFWHNNRLHAKDVDASVLAYMTNMLGYSPAEVTRTVASNRPSAAMAAYYLLLSMINRIPGGLKSDTVKEKKSPSGRPKANRLTGERQSGGTRTHQTTLGNDEDEVDGGASSSSFPTLGTSPEAVVTLNTRGPLLLPDVLGAKQPVIHLSPPITTASHLCDSAPSHVPTDPPVDGSAPKPVRPLLIGTSCSDGGRGPPEAVLRSKALRKSAASPRMQLDPSQGAPPTTLPRLCNPGAKNARGGKVLWAPLNPPGPTGLRTSASKTHPLAGKCGKAAGTKRTSRRRITELSLPLLPATLRRKSDRKLHSINC